MFFVGIQASDECRGLAPMTIYSKIQFQIGTEYYVKKVEIVINKLFDEAHLN